MEQKTLLISNRHLNRLASKRVHEENLAHVDINTMENPPPLIPYKQLPSNAVDDPLTKPCSCEKFYEDLSKNIRVLKTQVAKQTILLERIMCKLNQDDPNNPKTFQFPIQNDEKLIEVEERLIYDDTFAKKMVICLRNKIKKTKSMGKVFRSMFHDDVLFNFNFDGNCSKQKFSELKIYEALKQAWLSFEYYEEQELQQEIRKFLRNSKNRKYRQ